MALMDCSTKLMIELTPESINDFLRECEDFGESCDVLYNLKNGDAEVFLNRIRFDHRIEYIAEVDNSKILAVARISRNPNAANGKIGYCVRPMARKRGHGRTILAAAVKFALINDIEPITCVAGDLNGPSIHTILSSGFEPTGRTYEWTPNPKPRKGIEFEFDADCKQ